MSKRSLEEQKEMLDKLEHQMRLLIVDICFKVLSRGDEKIDREDILSVRAGEQICEVSCIQGVFVIDRQDEQIISFTPNPNQKKVVIH